MEGPGVRLVKERLSFLVGKIIREVDGTTKERKESLVGKRITNIISVGKRLFIEVDDLYLIVHFLMYGSYRINEKKDNLKERIRLVVDKDIVNFYNCSVKIIERSKINIDTSIDILSENFNIKRALETIKTYDGYICDLLLDQNVFAGVGNIIKNEALFRARIHPLSISKNINEEVAKKLISVTIKFSKLFYKRRKKGLPLKPKLLAYGKRKCLFCGSKIIIKYLGKTRRKTYYCESCQKLY